MSALGVTGQAAADVPTRSARAPKGGYQWPAGDHHMLSAAMRGAHQRGSRVVSICSGAFVLAAAGLLDGRKAATHGQYAERPARTYPNVHVDREVLYVDDGDVLTSAGSAAGIDLCLHLIRRDHGATVANQVARRLVVPAHCDGGQSQYVERPVAVGNDTRIHDVIAWLEHTLAEPVSIAALAPVPLHSLPWRTEIRRPETPWPSSGASPADPSVCTAPPLRWPTRFGTRSGLCGSAPTGSSSTAAAPCSQ